MRSGDVRRGERVLVLDGGRISNLGRVHAGEGEIAADGLWVATGGGISVADDGGLVAARRTLPGERRGRVAVLRDGYSEVSLVAPARVLWPADAWRQRIAEAKERAVAASRRAWAVIDEMNALGEQFRGALERHSLSLSSVQVVSRREVAVVLDRTSLAGLVALLERTSPDSDQGDNSASSTTPRDCHTALKG